MSRGHEGAEVIRVEALTKRYGHVLAVDGLTFAVRSGTVTGFLGPNGAGKSTTLRVILGLAHAGEGSATIFGEPYARLREPARTVGALLDPQVFHPGRSGRNALRVSAVTAGIGPRRVDEALELVGLTADAGRKVGGYSTGMRQRLGLAGALLGDPAVLVLDEPANGLDPEGMRWLRTFLREFADGGRTVLVSSHVLAELEQLADHVVIINRGRLVTQGALAELSGLAGGQVVARSPRAPDLAAVLEAHGRKVHVSDSGELLVEAASAAAVGELAHVHQIPLHELRADRLSLEELFLELTDGTDAGGPNGHHGAVAVRHDKEGRTDHGPVRGVAEVHR
jgi:ABC-2 type transport system ATP-binding protein